MLSKEDRQKARELCARATCLNTLALALDTIDELERERDVARRAMGLFCSSPSESGVTIDGDIYSVYGLRGEWTGETLLSWCYALAEAESEATR